MRKHEAMERGQDKHAHGGKRVHQDERATMGDGLLTRQIGRRHLLTGMLAGGAWLAAGGPALALSRASGVRFGSHDGFVRIVLDLSDEVSYGVFTLPDPHRVVIDLPEMDWAIPEDGLSGGGGLVKAVRWGLFQPGNGRLVMDLHGPAAVRKTFLLPPASGAGWRLVMDLAQVSPEEFLRTAGPDRRLGSFTPGQAPTAQPAPQDAAIRPPADPTAPRPNNRKPIVVLDPGHGGVDPGAIGVSGVYEKTLTLSAGKEFKAMLEATGRYTVHLTRDRDIFIPLRERIAIARARQADLFVSIHADAVGRSSVQGLSVYTLSENASDAEAAALADHENKADIIAGIDLSRQSAEVTNILIDLAQRETMNQSSRMAETMISELRREVNLLPQTHRFAGFAVLKAPDVPSMLVEMGYLSNPEEEKLLRQAKYRAKLGEALVRSTDRYFTTVQKAAR